MGRGSSKVGGGGGGGAGRTSSSSPTPPKYSVDEIVYVRIPARISGTPRGAVSRVKIFSVGNDGSYMITSARYGLLRFSENDIFKHRSEVR